MKTKSIIISTSAVALFCIFAITAAYKSTDTPKPKPENTENATIQEESVEIYRPLITAEPSPSPKAEYESIYYYLQSEENLLKLYEINGNSKKVVKNIEFEPNMLPAEDRQLLQGGIKADTLEEGIEIIENFIS